MSLRPNPSPSRQSSWRAPLRRARRAVDRTFRRIHACNRVIEVAQRAGTARPIAASRRLQHAADCIGDAAVELQRAMRGVRESAERVAREPERAAAAPALLVATTALWLEAAARLDAVSLRMVATSARLVENAACGKPPRGARPTRTSLVLIRRQWFAAATAADAARRISRGRAPPLRFSLPALNTAD